MDPRRSLRALFRVGIAAALLAPPAATQVRPSRPVVLPDQELNSSQLQSLTRQLQNRAVTRQDTALLRTLNSRMTAVEFARLAQGWSLEDSAVSTSFADTLVRAETSAGPTPVPEAEGPVYVLPETQVQAVAGRGTRSLQVYLQAHQLEWDPDSAAFIGRVHAWTQDPLSPEDPGRLARPIGLQVMAAVDRVIPDPASLDRIGIPVTTIEIRDADALDSVPILVVTETKPEGYRLTLPVRPALLVEPASRRLQGWGVEAVPVNVTVLGSGTVQATEVDLLTEEGSVSPGTDTVSSARPARFLLRSGGPGRSRLSVSTTRYGSATTEVEYTLPVRFFLAAIIGGLIGMFLAGGEPGGSMVDRLRTVLKGVLAGIVAAGAYLVLGTNVLPIELPSQRVFNEGLVFLVATFGALAWSRGALLFQGWGRKAEA
jgi:hypothetical protein